MTAEPHDIPTATVERVRRNRAFWIVPIIAFGVAAWLLAEGWSQRGVTIVVRFDDGHGLRAEDPVRYRGIDVGVVSRVTLSREFDGVDVHIRLDRHANAMARNGSRFWIVRPELGLRAIGGLDTIAGPRYVAVRPGTGAMNRRFQGLSVAPIVEQTNPDDLEIILQAKSRGSLAPGAPVRYRDVRIGTVLSVALASDGSAVEARVHIEGPYTPIIRRASVFWDDGGFDADVGLSGVKLRVTSLESLLLGGVAVATPENDAVDSVRTGARFELFDGPKEEWFAWSPVVEIGSRLFPAGTPTPQPVRAQLIWTEGRLMTSTKRRRGWTLMTTEGLLGPLDLFREEDARDGSMMLELSGETIDPTTELSWSNDWIGLLPVALEKDKVRVWPGQRLRAMDAPVDVVIVADPRADERLVAAARMAREEDEAHWVVDESISFEPSWHGAIVVSQKDGFVVGVLIVRQDEAARIVTWPSRSGATDE